MRQAGSLLLSLLVLGLCVSPLRAAPVEVPGGVVIQNVDFERHLMGVFGRMGCNAGSCHGSFQGKGGFRLSLFGYDPEKDYITLTREAQGRRMNMAEPERSLLLLKATGQVPHEGLTRFGKDTWAYKLFVEWLKQGAPRRAGSGEVVSVAITPSEVAMNKPGEKNQIQVWATFKDGSKENITPFCDFRTNDDAVADVTNIGEVRGIQPGDTAIVVSYRGNILPVRVMVPLETKAGYQYPKLNEVNFIDREVFAKLKRLNIVPSDLSSDTEFLRRVTIDTIGCLPTPEEVRAFLADNRPDKRERKVDELLAHPMHAALWATKFCDITGNNTDALENPQGQRPKLSQMWHDWFRKRVADNMPYDQIVKGVLTATSREGRKPEEWMTEVKSIAEQMEKGFQTDYAKRDTLDLFWRRQQPVPIDQWGQKTAAAFLGVRIECAECHKHPFDRWTQNDYRSYANIFTSITFGISTEAKKVIDEENTARKTAQAGQPANKVQLLPVREIFVGNPTKGLTNQDTAVVLTPKALGGPEFKSVAGQDARQALFNWMRDPENPFFARSFANRIWGHYFGRGIVDPVDDFSLANPPSNPLLLDALAKEFVASGFNIRKLERAILLSRTYQASSTVNETNKFDRINYSHSYVRPMMAEVVVDVLDSALNVTETYGNDAPAGCRAIEVGSSRVTNQQVGYVLRIFGRPPRTTACDCERAMEPGLPQKLFMMADPSMDRKLNDPKNRIATVAAIKDDDKAMEELFLATLSRLPTDADRELFRKHLAKSTDRVKAFRAAAWALLNTTEFISNH
jgi:hypothetical protein